METIDATVVSQIANGPEISVDGGEGCSNVDMDTEDLSDCSIDLLNADVDLSSDDESYNVSFRLMVLSHPLRIMM